MSLFSSATSSLGRRCFDSSILFFFFLFFPPFLLFGIHYRAPEYIIGRYRGTPWDPWTLDRAQTKILPSRKRKSSLAHARVRVSARDHVVPLEKSKLERVPRQDAGETPPMHELDFRDC